MIMATVKLTNCGAKVNEVLDRPTGAGGRAH